MPTPATQTFSVPPEADGKRLDAFLASVLTGFGQRGAKRLIAGGNVHVAGKARPAHWKLRAGAEVTLYGEPPHEAAHGTPTLLAANTHYAAFTKPSGLHTAAVSGSPEPSLEAHMASHWPAIPLYEATPPHATSVMEALRALACKETRRDVQFSSPLEFPDSVAEHLTPPVLLGRLDAATSGIVPAAFSREDAEQFRQDEIQCRVFKYYLALVVGEMHEPRILRNRLDMAERRQTRVLETLDTDPTRWTHATPLVPHAHLEAAGFLPACGVLPSSDEKPLTLVAARIHRGARHQIRAHLAHAGFPILGDTLYGENNAEQEYPRLFLHHALLSMPGFAASLAPAWFCVGPDAQPSTQP